MTASLYSDENFHFNVVLELRNRGHDVLTALEAGQANQKIPDHAVLAFAVSLRRALLTNDTDFVKLHKQQPSHCGIVYCTEDLDSSALAQRVHQAILANLPLDNKL